MKTIKFSIITMTLLVFAWQGNLHAQGGTVVFDQEIYWEWPTSGNDYGGYGFYWWHRNEGVVNINFGSMSSTDWTSPSNFYDGDFVMRFEVLDQPTSEDFYVQFGIWQDKWKGENHPETVAGRQYLSGGTGSVFEGSLGSPNGWWNKESGDPVDFSRPEDFYRIGIVLWNADPLCIPKGEDWGGGCPELEGNFFPMRARVTIIAYPSSSTPTYAANFKVTDGSENVEGANININGQNITTNSSGEASINLVNGNHYYTVTKYGFQQKSGTVNISDSNVTENVTLTHAYVVTFDVKDESSNAIQGANVSVNGTNLSTNSSGVATISLTSGDYDYTISKSGYQNNDGTVSVSDSDVVELVTLNLNSYDVSFTVEDEGANPIEGTNININGTDLTTDQNGNAIISLNNGDYDYTISAAGYDQKSGSLTVAGADLDQNVVLTETTYSITINVKDQDGAAVEGATVSIDGNDLATDSNGDASLDLVNGNYDFTVSKDGYENADGSVEVAGAPVTENVTLIQITYTITFSVTDESATALEGAAIAIDGSDLTADVNGEATIELPDGNFDYTVSLSEYGDETGTIVIDGAGLTENVTLTKTTYVITFKVTDDEANSLEGASISVHGEDLTTDANGEATLELVNGNYEYIVSLDGYNDDNGSVAVSGSDVTESVIMSIETFTLSFTVLDGNSDPVEGAEILINTENLTTDSNGQASTDLLDGDYNYSVSMEGFEQYDGSVTIAGVDLAEDVTLTALTYLVTFTVLDENSDPVEGAAISVEETDLETDSNGEASLELANGEYNYSVSIEGFNDFNGSLVVEGADLDENVSLSGSVFILTFVISDEEENFLAGASVSVNETDLTTDENGVATIELANGEYNYSVSMDGYEDASGSVSISGSDQSEELSLELETSTTDITAARISVYPNPGSEIFIIESRVAFKPDTRFEVISVSGVRVYSYVNQGETDRVNLNLSNVSKGVYFLNIKTDDGEVMKRIVVR